MTAAAYFNRFPSYCRMVAHAKSLANRSVLVDHCGLEHIDLSSELANVERVYAIDKENRRSTSKLSLIEFKSSQDADRIARCSHHNPGLLPVPLKILRYNARSSASEPPQHLPYPIEHVRLNLDRELSPSFSSYAELVSNNLMSLVALKLRFITLVNFEQILCSGMFEEYELMPFGSSVIDMGCDAGDLDIIFIRKNDHYSLIHDQKRQHHLATPASTQQSSLSSKLVHLDKSLYRETKDSSGFRGAMRWFDNVLREYMPLTDGFGVLTLHRAKVPIIKFTSRITNIDCDLSFDLGLELRDIESAVVPINHGILMTEILYSLCRNNNLITALVIYLRIFAKLNSITSKVSGIGMTNFQFLSIVIFFLQKTRISAIGCGGRLNEDDDQQVSHDEIPLQQYPTSSMTKDSRFVIGATQLSNEEALIPPFKKLVDSSFLQELSHQTCHYNDEELNQIMPPVIKLFFDFCSTFDFAKSSMNLFEARRERKLDNSSIYVLNPIDRQRNICHNVNRRGLEVLVKQSRVMSQMIRSRDNACPLELIKTMLSKQAKQAKKNRLSGLDIAEEDDAQPFSPEGIAEDVCR